MNKRNPVAKHLRTFCKAAKMANRKRLHKNGYTKHRGSNA